jgi:hypothetical protein
LAVSCYGQHFLQVLEEQSSALGQVEEYPMPARCLRIAFLSGLIALTLLAIPALAKGTGGRVSSPRPSASRAARIPRSTPRPSAKATARPRTSRCSSCTRNANGRIKRSSNAKHEFQRSHPCPSNGRTSGGCPGYVVDHVTPLKRGGADAPNNMQWQTKEQAKAKDKVE